MVPIINGNQTGWEHLYTALNEAEKIKKYIFKDWKTITLFDLQFHIKAMSDLVF